MHRNFAQALRSLLACGCALLFVSALQPGGADTTTEKKRALMAKVKRVVIVPPFFATDTLTKAEPGRKPAPNEGNQSAPSPPVDPRLTEYAGQLRKLTEHVATRLPARAGARTPFTVVPAEEVAAALKALDWTPEKLFQNGGRMRGTRYPLPAPEAVKQLAARLHADAVLLTALDEPRRNGNHLVFNLITGMDYRTAQVEACGGFNVVMADGTVALTDDLAVVHPLTHIGNRQFLMVDWTEAEDVMVEDLMDEWTRYTP
jgi:hypothetical protein